MPLSYAARPFPNKWLIEKLELVYVFVVHFMGHVLGNPPQSGSELARHNAHMTVSLTSDPHILAKCGNRSDSWSACQSRTPILDQGLSITVLFRKIFADT